MSRRLAATFLLAATVAIIVTQYFWMNISTPEPACPSPEPEPAPAPVTVTVTVPVTVPAPSPTEDVQKELPLQGPRNSTLGFQKIYYISMPKRTDRQDMMTLIGGYLNLELTKMDGVNGSEIAPKAYPYDMRNPPEPARGHVLPRAANVGCWRAHANVWSHMVSHGIASAMIFEDDADFSLGIRDIMEGLSKQLQKATGAKNGEPYGIVDGNSWDMLTLGHCGYRIPDAKTNPKAAKKMRIWADPWAPESPKVGAYAPNAINKHLRLLAPSKGSICNQGYAITREGAMRLLYNIGGPGHVLNQAKDLLIMETLYRGKLKGYLTVPDIVAQWKVADWRDTDIQLHSEQQLKKFRKGTGKDIVRSVREEIESTFSNRDVWQEIESEEDEEDEEDDDEGEEGEEEEMAGELGGKLIVDEEAIAQAEAMLDEKVLTEEEQLRREEELAEDEEMRKVEALIHEETMAEEDLPLE